MKEEVAGPFSSDAGLAEPSWCQKTLPSGAKRNAARRFF
jgi:hypothetical protein